MPSQQKDLWGGETAGGGQDIECKGVEDADKSKHPVSLCLLSLWNSSCELGRGPGIRDRPPESVL